GCWRECWSAKPGGGSHALSGGSESRSPYLPVALDSRGARDPSPRDIAAASRVNASMHVDALACIRAVGPPTPNAAANAPSRSKIGAANPDTPSDDSSSVLA